MSVVMIYPDFMNPVTHPWSRNKHIVNSSKVERTTAAGDLLQICDVVLLQVSLALLRMIDLFVDRDWAKKWTPI